MTDTITTTAFSGTTWPALGGNQPFPVRRVVTLTVAEPFEGGGTLDFSIVTADSEDMAGHHTIWAQHRSGSGSAEYGPFTAGELTAARTFKAAITSQPVGKFIGVRYQVDGEPFTAGAIVVSCDQFIGDTEGVGTLHQSPGAALAPSF